MARDVAGTVVAPRLTRALRAVCAACPREGRSPTPFDPSMRQSEFCGEDTTARVDMRKLRFRPRPSCPRGGVPSRTAGMRSNDLRRWRVIY